MATATVLRLAVALAICLLAALPALTHARDLVRDTVDTYRKIMEAKGHVHFTAQTMVDIYKLHDGDADCGLVCQRAIEQMFTEAGGTQSSDWDFFYKLINKIYEGQISLDPFMPQVPTTDTVYFRGPNNIYLIISRKFILL
jgi:hypothetical protein